MTHAENVPVKIGKMVVGSARIHENGTIDVSMDAPNPLGQEILHLITSGLVQGISIAPISVPARPAAGNWMNSRNAFRDRHPR